MQVGSKEGWWFRVTTSRAVRKQQRAPQTLLASEFEVFKPAASPAYQVFVKEEGSTETDLDLADQNKFSKSATTSNLTLQIHTSQVLPLTTGSIRELLPSIL